MFFAAHIMFILVELLALVDSFAKEYNEAVEKAKKGE